MPLGNVILISVFTFHVLIDLGLLLIWIATGNLIKMIVTVIRIGITIVMMLAIYRGSNWVRILFLIFIILGLTIELLAVFQDPHPVMIGIVIYFGIMGYVLGFSRNVKAFLEVQRQRYQGSGPRG